jgi:hypothetical protein
MKRIVIDTMVVDLIADTPGLLEQVQEAARRGALSFVVTHIIRDQLAAAPAGRRDTLLGAYDALPKTQVPTKGFVLGLSRLGEARLGDGSETGVSAHDVRPSGDMGGLADALIATTASGDADVLVTADSALRAKAQKAGVRCDVWDLAQFVAFVKDRAN